ncbi:MAG: sarcosine oxidase subunit alpha family protein [Rhizobiaceae bacterium]
MTAKRLHSGSRIDRKKPIKFTFDGKLIPAFEGDTIASTLLAANNWVVGRSFKYHRPRGIWGAGVEEPNALVDIEFNNRNFPVSRATTEFVEDGMVVTTVNGHVDRAAILDKFAKFIPAAFYYKTFMWPDWHLFEPHIREMAGLGRINTDLPETGRAEQINHHCDVLVIGGGPAGLMAASMASKAGKSVLLVDNQRDPGGSLLHMDAKVEEQSADDWITDNIREIEKAGGKILQSTTAYGIYDHQMIYLNEKRSDMDRLWRVRAGHIIVATGAIERPMVFQNNDRPGIMSADAGLKYLKQFGVLPGQDIVVATNNDSAYNTAQALRDAGANITLLDSRKSNQANGDFDILTGKSVTNIIGKNRIEAVVADNQTIKADLLLVSGGWTPSVHLYCQAGGKLDWNDTIAAFVPRGAISGISVIGAANGTFNLSDLFAEAKSAASDHGQPTTSKNSGFNIEPNWHDPSSKGRAWVDYQNDVTIKDVELAARENFKSVEHLKRYTTLGMANDQGKTSNINGLAAMAAITGRKIEEVGTTTYRPPFTPVPFASIAGKRSGELFNPVKRLPLENWHRTNGASFREYGGWLRPAFYGKDESKIASEAEYARASVALFDGSTLGKIEVMGPDAAKFLNFQYYNTVSTLKPGKIRYAFMLTEGGVIYDDGVLARLSENHFIVSCSTSHVDGVHRRLEMWRQDQFDPAKIAIHNATSQWATLTITGPKSAALLSKIDFNIDFGDEAFLHMSIRIGKFDGADARISRVSFSGDRSYEIAVPAHKAEALWIQLHEVGAEFDAATIGVEAMSVLRAEKGFIIIGKDTDGTTMPQDLGLTGPMINKKSEYLGKRSLFTENAKDENRRQLVGLQVAKGDKMLVTGAHGIERDGNEKRSIGYVTSSYKSPNTNSPIALALIERGLSRMGEEIEIWNMSQSCKATICSPCFFDPSMERLNA